jgi:hypothetical protein
MSKLSWNDFVKKFAAENSKSYMCAMSDGSASTAYKKYKDDYKSPSELKEIKQLADERQKISETKKEVVDEAVKKQAAKLNTERILKEQSSRNKELFPHSFSKLLQGRTESYADKMKRGNTNEMLRNLPKEITGTDFDAVLQDRIQAMEKPALNRRKREQKQRRTREKAEEIKKIEEKKALNRRKREQKQRKARENKK